MYLTIFTPTYNRSGLLKRLYDSLCKQSNKSFEWLIVDDGSKDNTGDLVKDFIAENKINIRYIKKSNGGKHTAHNLAINEANGEYLFCVDSDDWLPENSVENISQGIEMMNDDDYAVIGYKVLPNGQMLCSDFGNEILHMGVTKLNKVGICGEFSIVMKLDTIKNYPFPVIDGEKFCTESVLYDLLELNGYKVCTLPYILTICEYQDGGLSGNGYKLVMENPVSYKIYHMQKIDLSLNKITRFRHCVQYHAFNILSRDSEYTYRGKYKKLLILTTFFGYPAVLYYKRLYYKYLRGKND